MVKYHGSSRDPGCRTSPLGGRAARGGAPRARRARAGREERAHPEGPVRGHEPPPEPRPRAVEPAGAGPPPGGTSADPRSVPRRPAGRSEEHTSELQSRFDLVCRLLLEKKKKNLDVILCVKNKKKTKYKL